MKSIEEIVEAAHKFVESMKAHNREYEQQHDMEPMMPDEYEILKTKVVQKALEVRLRYLEATVQ